MYLPAGVRTLQEGLRVGAHRRGLWRECRCGSVEYLPIHRAKRVNEWGAEVAKAIERFYLLKIVTKT